MLETIDYYNQSSVCVLLKDASKAFDKVNYCKLFTDLLKRDVTISSELIITYVYESDID